jgi:hemerythrin-like domain-containing protein
VCEYCGCQSLAVIAELTDEHDRLRSLGRELTVAGQASDRRAAASVAERMLAILRPHTAVEEGGLFPALADDFPRQMNDLAEDHQRIEAALAQVATGVRADWAATSVAAVTDLFEHILKEQDGVFPAALATLSPTQWDRVAAARGGTVEVQPVAEVDGSAIEDRRNVPQAVAGVTRSPGPAALL